MIAPHDGGILGIFPIFYSLSTTHRILTYWKDRGGERLRRILFSPSPDLKAALARMGFEAVIPIPQDQHRSLKRGHASAMEVGRFFAGELKIPLLGDVLLLKHSIGVKQANLNAWERRHSENPFEARAITQQKILLVDDFITTGATLDKAANALLEQNPSFEMYAASLGWRPSTKIIERRSS